MHAERMAHSRRSAVRMALLATCVASAVPSGCQSPAALDPAQGDALADPSAPSAFAEDQFWLHLPQAHSTSSLREDLSDRLRSAGIEIRHTYSERVGLANSVAVRADRQALARIVEAWPGLIVEPAALRFLDGCGDGRCESEEAASSMQTTSCSLDCGVPLPRWQRNELANSYGALYTGAVSAWAYTRGAGVDVCILDTGFDHGAASTHRDRPRNLLGGYNFFDRNDNYSSVDSHGTHVAGLLAAADNSYGMVGVTPDANIRIYTIFGRYRGRLGATDTDIVAALDAAIADRCRIVNMSFGAPAPSPPEERALSAAYAAGILLVAAAGNAEDSPHGQIRTADQHYPAAYREVLAVAATDPNDALAPFSSTGKAVGIAAPGVALYSTFPTGTGDREATLRCGEAGQADFALSAYAPIAGSGTSLGRTAVALCGYGSTSEIAACAPAGHIALIRRGPTEATQKALPFTEKVENARRAGAVGVLLYNHRSGEPAQAGRLLTNIDVGSAIPIPVAAVAAGDGEYLADRIRSGADVGCSLANGASDHAFLDGTSMAAPLVSGSAALIASRFPALSNVALRQLLQETAFDLGAPGRDDSYGFGLVDVVAALRKADPTARCGDGVLNTESEVCEGSLTRKPFPRCDDLGFDGDAGGQVTCNTLCSGLDATRCGCLPDRKPFDVGLSLSRNYPRGSTTGTLAHYGVLLDGKPVSGAMARVITRSATAPADRPPARSETIGPSSQDGRIWQFFPNSPSAAGLPAGDYEVRVFISKGGNRCRDEQALPPFRITLATSP